MAAVVGIVRGCGLSIHMPLAKKRGLLLYKPLLHCNSHLKQLYLSNKTQRFSYKGIPVGMVDVDVRISSHLKEELVWAADKRLRVISARMLFKKSYSTKELKETKE